MSRVVEPATRTSSRSVSNARYNRLNMTMMKKKTRKLRTVDPEIRARAAVMWTQFCKDNGVQGWAVIRNEVDVPDEDNEEGDDNASA